MSLPWSRLPRCSLRAVAGVLLGLSFIGRVPGRADQPIEFTWPTPNPAWSQGLPPRSFLQHAGSGDPDSGGFGGVRSGGLQFHEGIDLKPMRRDRRGEPTDPISAALPGVVRHVSVTAGNSSYGRYVVLEHPDMAPAVYTLYAHLARIAPGLKVGDRVAGGQTIGTMGHTAGGYVIPRDRAHLHFEIGVMVTRNFQRWYDSRRFGSRNEHGLWNGMNLMGLDPLDLLTACRDRRLTTLTDYFARLEPVLRVRIATALVPDFVARYPELLTRPLPPIVGGWEIKFNSSGVPFAWTPLGAAEIAGLALNDPEVREVNAALLRQERSKSLAALRRGQWVPGRDLEIVLQQLFGLR